MNRTVSTALDTDQMEPEEAMSLLDKLDEADFFCLPSTMESGAERASGADQFCYKVTIEVAGAEHTVEATDEDAPQELQPLLDELTRLARTSGA